VGLPRVRCKFAPISCQSLPKWFTVRTRGPVLLIKRACCVLSVIDGAWFDLSLLIKIICGLHVMKNYSGQRRTWLHSYIHAAAARETHLCCSSHSRRQRTSIKLICPLTRHDPVNTIFFTLKFQPLRQSYEKIPISLKFISIKCGTEKLFVSYLWKLTWNILDRDLKFSDISIIILWSISGQIFFYVS